ncbi:cox3 (mitochondrion) [Scenedesmus sp. PABB004]|nr:cox3 [Scenedesmus sp. PABB004]
MSTRTRGGNRPHHGYHLVDPSPWPALTRFSIFWLLLSMVLFFHQYAGRGTLVLFAFCAVAYTATVWWRDVHREGVLGFHTRKVKNGLHLGMMLFIWSEAMFFVGLLWAFLHRSLMPTIQVGMSWPPLGIVPVQWYGLPKVNTLLLLRSYFTANAAKHALENNQKNLCKLQLRNTIFLGLLFVYCQYLEYTGSRFTFSDSIFGSAFYLTTGFHGFHVIVGFLYLRVCLLLLPTTKPGQSIALDLRVLYWHFVDIVWVFLMLLVYGFGCAMPTSELQRCTDGSCALSHILYERKRYSFAHPA